MELMLPLEAEAILATEEKVLLLLLPMLLRDGAMTEENADGGHFVRRGRTNRSAALLMVPTPSLLLLPMLRTLQPVRRRLWLAMMPFLEAAAPRVTPTTDDMLNFLTSHFVRIGLRGPQFLSF